MIKEFLAHEALPGVSFLWPSLQLQSDGLYDVSEATPFIIDRPMSRSRFLELFRGALIQVGVPPPLPTLATCLGLEGNDLQAVGSWVEVPAGGGPNPRVKSRACWLLGRQVAANVTSPSWSSRPCSPGSGPCSAGRWASLPSQR